MKKIVIVYYINIELCIVYTYSLRTLHSNYSTDLKWKIVNESQDACFIRHPSNLSYLLPYLWINILREKAKKKKSNTKTLLIDVAWEYWTKIQQITYIWSNNFPVNIRRRNKRTREDEEWLMDWVLTRVYAVWVCWAITAASDVKHTYVHT